ncbi:hypothetical protein WBP06_00495 [Novosphingobium sp. BL-8H]|uniref:hypothetical protein n=1 Tax=Novosphingobium sp. BL-8H TaxID=3127640 RepID=UPI0037575106
MLTRAFIVPAERLGAVIAWMEERCSTDQASTIDVQSRVVAIECVSAMAADQIAARMADRPGWRWDQDLWLFLEALEPCQDIEAECQLAHEIVADCGLSDECEVAECRVLEVGFPSEAGEAAFQTTALNNFL